LAADFGVAENESSKPEADPFFSRS